MYISGRVVTVDRTGLAAIIFFYFSPSYRYTSQVMKSDRNRHSGDVVLDSVNIVYRDEEFLLGKICKMQIYSDFSRVDCLFLCD